MNHDFKFDKYMKKSGIQPKQPKHWPDGIDEVIEAIKAVFYPPENDLELKSEGDCDEDELVRIFQCR